MLSCCGVWILSENRQDGERSLAGMLVAGQSLCTLKFSQCYDFRRRTWDNANIETAVRAGHGAHAKGHATRRTGPADGTRARHMVSRRSPLGSWSCLLSQRVARRPHNHGQMPCRAPHTPARARATRRPRVVLHTNHHPHHKQTTTVHATTSGAATRALRFCARVLCRWAQCP